MDNTYDRGRIFFSLEELINNFDRNNEIPPTARVRLTLDNTLKGPRLGDLKNLQLEIEREF